MDLLKLNLDELLQFARDKISEYCGNECDALCCKNGIYLQTIDPGEVRLLLDLDQSADLRKVAKNDKRLYVNKSWLNHDEYSVNLDPCRFLDGKMCRIYNDPGRPEICSQYPVIKDKPRIVLASQCPAVKKGLIRDSLKLVQIMRYDIEYF